MSLIVSITNDFCLHILTVAYNIVLVTGLEISELLLDYSKNWLNESNLHVQTIDKKSHSMLKIFVMIHKFYVISQVVSRYNSTMLKR